MVSVKDVADYFNVHTNTILVQIKNGKIKAVKIGKIYRISEDEFNKIKKEGY